MGLKMRIKSLLRWTCGFLVIGICVLLGKNSTVVFNIENDQNETIRALNNTFTRLVSAVSPGSKECLRETACRLKWRNDQIKHVCRHDNQVKRNQTQRFLGYLDKAHKLLYFSIPKVGCSFWKRIFKVLNPHQGDFHLFDIATQEVHNDTNESNFTRVRSRKAVKKYLANYTSFVFVRDPFSRLFSGYIDKVFLPSKLGRIHSHVITRIYRNVIDKKRCLLKTPFSDFSTYIADFVYNMNDVHFIPMWRMCNPCDVNVTFVGKMETFMKDTTHILSSVGVSLDDVTGVNNSGFQFQEKNERGIIRDLATATFKFVRNRKHLCLTRKEVLQRIWTVYYIRGFLSKHQKMPRYRRPENVTLERFLKSAWRAYDRSMQKPELKLQREEAMKEAYSQVPRPVLQKLSQAFDMDCRVFGYSCDVDLRFPNTEKIPPFYFL